MNAPVKSAPVINPKALELIAFGRSWSTFRLRTPHRLEEIARPGYFDPALDAGVKVGDVIEIMAAAPDSAVRVRGEGTLSSIDGATYASVAVSRIGPATEAPCRVSVRPLVAYFPQSELEKRTAA